MAIYTVIIDKKEALAKVVAKLQEHYPDNYYEYHGQEGIFFVRTEDISEKIANKIGIKGNDRIEDATGAVFKMNSNYSGFTAGAVWEWLEQDG